MSYMDDVDTKHVKRGKFGPLDVYPQEDKQKEDELSTDFVRLGFKYQIPDLLRDYEYMSVSREQPISTSTNFDNDVVRVLLQIVNKREEASVNNQIEASKKQAVPAKVTQTFRPSLILMTGNQKTKESAYAWFKQLANNEPLVKLAKKFPVFNKRADNLPEILITLYEYQVPISRAVWYLKIMVLACSTNLNEANKKKRQPNVDVSSEWSLPLIRLLREIFNRLQFYEQLSKQHHPHYMQQNLSLESFMNVENSSLILLPVINHSYLTEKKLKCLWNFTTKLMRAMLDQNLLDKQLILESLVDLLEKSVLISSNQANQVPSRNPVQQMQNAANSSSGIESFTINKLLLTTKLLSRRLAYFCCKRLSNLFNEYSNVFFENAIKQLQQQSQSTNPCQQSTDQQAQTEIVNYLLKNEISLSSIKTLFNKFIQCPFHHDQIILLISIVHAVQLGCVQALIWNKVGDGRSESPYNGSALDFLPCPPSTLLFSYDYLGISKRTKQYVRRELEKAELCIKRRSIAVETKWTTDKLKQASIGIMQTKILAILDILDKYCYDLSDVNETIEILYSQIFPKLDLVKTNKPKSSEEDKNDLDDEDSNEDAEDETNEMNKPLSDKDIINLLCDWATTTRRCGLHRIFYAVFLIKKRQIDLIQQIKEFNKIIKNKIIKKINKTKKVKNASNTSDGDKMDNVDSVKGENSRKRKLKSIETEEEEDEDDDTNNKDIDEQMDSAFESPINAQGDDSLQPNLAKKIKLEPLNPDDFDKTNKILANAPKTSINKIKQKFKANRKKNLKLKRALYLNKKRREFLKQKELEERKSYEYPFQKILFDYLEHKSNSLSPQDMDNLINSNAANIQFANLISLFHMFINCKIFSHDQFVSDLIARGETFRNNLSDIKRPVNVFMNFKKKQMELKQQQQQQQLKQQNNTSKISQYPVSRNSIEYPLPLSVDQNQPASMPPYNLPPHTPLQHQKSLSNLNQDSLYNMAPHSVPTPCKSSLNPPEDLNLSLNSNRPAKTVVKAEPKKEPMSKMVVYVLNLPLPQTQSYQHERNQRFVLLYGFGAKKQEIQEKIHSTTKMFQRLFSRKFSIDLNDVTTITSLSNPNSKRANSIQNSNKHYNIITNTHVCLSGEEQANLAQIQSEYAKMSYYDQYSIVNKINVYLIEIFKSLDQKNYLPKLQFIQFLFDLMESNMNIFNMFLFSIRLLHIGPLIEQYLRAKFILNNNSSNSSSGNQSGNSGSNTNLSNSTQNSSNSNLNAANNKSCYFEYLSHFYLNIIGVLRLHLISLVLWKDLAIEVFKCLFKLVKHVERPSKCSSHEKCALALLNEMYTSCGYIKSTFTQFEPIANKIRLEKCFTQVPQLDKTNSSSISYQMKSDELLTSMITTTDHTIDEIENYVTSKGLQYNFVAHVFVYISNLPRDEMLRVANLSAELTSRCNILIPFWQNASKSLHHRNTEPSKEKAMFSELLNKINIQNPKCKENFKLFLSILASRHCLILNELIIMVVKTCVMACPGITSDQSHNFSILEPSASLACHIIQYLFTSSPKPLQYRATSTDQRMIMASFRSILFNTFLLVLKCLFLLSDPKKDTSNNRMNRNNSSSNSKKEDKTSSDEQLELDQFAASVLQEICEHDWIKERCFHEGDNLLKANQLLEPALGRRAQNLLHIICYPQSHDLRKQNEQSSTKDFIRNILQNLDIWTLRESLLEFKLMIELEKQKERFYEYAVECLAKTTVDFLIDTEKSTQNALQRSTSQIDTTVSNETSQNEKEKESEENLTQSSDPVESMQLDEANNQTENISDTILAETDLNLNPDLDSADQIEVDEFENVELTKPNQPIGVWLIAPLITRLPDTCQTKVLENASKTLQDLGKAFWNAKNKVEKESQAIKNIIAWNQQPFFSLLISCLKNNNNNEQQQQRTLLTSLFNGLTDFINGKEDKILSEDPRIKQIMMDTLHIRLSLVGSMFDFILKNSNDFVNWAWLFVQLIYSGVVDPDNDQLLFTIITDMLGVLIHHIITLEPNLDTNKHYQSIIKKISKETKDFSDVPNTKAINHIRKLMPLNRGACLDIMTVDSYSTTASKTLSNLHDKRRGFKFARKEKINTWELIEGVKNASSLCLSWYGSTKLERKMLRYEYQQKLLHRHKHMNIHKELTYFKERPDVPNDLIELPEPVIVEPIKKEPKPIVNPVVKQMPTPVAQQNNLNSNFNPNESIKNSIQSPATNLNNSADIVVLDSIMPHQMAPNVMMSNPHQLAHHQPPQGLPHQGQMMPQQQQQGQMNPMMNPHSQLMNRLQSQAQQHQQQQQQIMQQQQQQTGLQLPIGQQINMPPNDRKALTRQLSATPDKTRGTGLKKQKSTTPRKANNTKAATAGNPQVPPVQQAPMNPANKLMPQPGQFHQNQMIPNQAYPTRPMGVNQQQPGMPISQGQMRMPSQPNFYQNQPNPPPQSLTPQPPNNQATYIQQPNQATNPRMMQPQQQPVAPQASQQAQVNRMPYPNPQQQQQQAQRKPVVTNQQAQVPAYQPTTRMIPQQQGQQPIFQGNNPQMYKQTSMPPRTSTTPDPTMVAQNNQAQMLNKPMQAQQNFQNPANSNFMSSQGQQPIQRAPMPQAATQPQQQRMQFNPNQSQGLTLPTQSVNQSQNINWQQQQQQQQRQQAMQRQQQQQPQQFAQQQGQYLQKQLSNAPMNQAQQGQQTQGYPMQQPQRQMTPHQQQQPTQPQQQQQQAPQQYQNY